MSWIVFIILYYYIYIYITNEKKELETRSIKLCLLYKEDKALLEMCKIQNYNWRRVSKSMT